MRRGLHEGSRLEARLPGEVNLPDLPGGVENDKISPIADLDTPDFFIEAANPRRVRLAVHAPSAMVEERQMLIMPGRG